MTEMRAGLVCLCAAIVIAACTAEPATSARGGAAGFAAPPTTGQQPAPGTPGAVPAAAVGTQPGATGAPSGGAAIPSTGVPCDVSTVIESNCLGCHGPTPIGGAIRLVEHADWHQPSRFDPTKLVHEVARVRIADGSMPQGAVMSPADLAVLDGWLAAGALQAGVGDTNCGGAASPVGGGETAAAPEPAVGPGGTIDTCSRPGAFDPLVARDGETCYEFAVTAPGGAGKFSIAPGESYHEWYYAVPWAPGDVWTRFGADFDNLEVLHHFLIFTSNAARAPGELVQNVLGTTLGTNATLIGGWAVGGCSTQLPQDVGGSIPSSSLIMVQWHMYNNTGAPAQDGTKVQVCTVPGSQRPNHASITFLGTENFNGPLGMPPGDNSFTTRCSNNSGQEVTVLGFTPHMHLKGTHMKTELTSASGTRAIFDMPFQFDYQVGYEIPPVTVMPGDTLTTTCSFFNDTGGNVAFGDSTNQEMCYQYVLYYPGGALDNGAPSLIGALNTCW